MKLLRFTLVALGLYLALPLLALVIDMIIGIDITNAGFAILPPMLAALLEGQYFARERGRVPSIAERVQVTMVGIMVIIGLNLIFVGVMFATAPDMVAPIRELLQSGAITGLILITFVVAAGSIFVFFWFGASNELKAIERRK